MRNKSFYDFSFQRGMGRAIIKTTQTGERGRTAADEDEIRVAVEEEEEEEEGQEEGAGE